MPSMLETLIKDSQARRNAAVTRGSQALTNIGNIKLGELKNLRGIEAKTTEYDRAKTLQTQAEAASLQEVIKKVLGDIGVANIGKEKDILSGIVTKGGPVSTSLQSLDPTTNAILKAITDAKVFKDRAAGLESSAGAGAVLAAPGSARPTQANIGDVPLRLLPELPQKGGGINFNAPLVTHGDKAAQTAGTEVKIPSAPIRTTGGRTAVGSVKQTTQDRKEQSRQVKTGGKTSKSIPLALPEPDRSNIPQPARPKPEAIERGVSPQRLNQSIIAARKKLGLPPEIQPTDQAIEFGGGILVSVFDPNAGREITVRIELTR